MAAAAKFRTAFGHTAVVEAAEEPSFRLESFRGGDPSFPDHAPLRATAPEEPRALVSRVNWRLRNLRAELTA